MSITFPNLLGAMASSYMYVCLFAVPAARAQVEGENGASTSPPAAKDLIEFLISRDVANIYRLMKSDKSTPREREDAVHQYHGVIFMVWVGAVDLKLPNIAGVDIESYTRGFLRSINKMKLEQFVDWDDPMGWKQFKSGGSKEEVIEFHNQFKYLSWVYSETKDPAKYREIVERFRKYCAEVSKKE